MKVKLVRGVGVNEKLYPSCENNKPVLEYSLWQHMLYRCTERYWAKYPTYAGVTCSENFKSYSYFYEWCNRQVGFKSIDEKGKNWNLDKDILVKNNKVYSEDICVFVPTKINSLLTKSNKARGGQPIGVSFYKNFNKFRAACNDGCGTQIYLGSFNSPLEAFQTYKAFKEGVIKQIADKYKPKLDSRVYQALLNYEVEQND